MNSCPGRSSWSSRPPVIDTRVPSEPGHLMLRGRELHAAGRVCSAVRRSVIVQLSAEEQATLGRIQDFRREVRCRSSAPSPVWRRTTTSPNLCGRSWHTVLQASNTLTCRLNPDRDPDCAPDGCTRCFRQQTGVRSGLLSIAPAAAEDRVATELLLTRSFAGTVEERSRDLVRCGRKVGAHARALTAVVLCLWGVPRRSRWVGQVRQTQ